MGPFFSEKVAEEGFKISGTTVLNLRNSSAGKMHDLRKNAESTASCEGIRGQLESQILLFAFDFG